MNKNLEKLCSIAKKDKRIIIGLMSGTSLDGLDVACCEITSHGIKSKVSARFFETVSYDAEFKNNIKEIFSKKTIYAEKLCLMNKFIGIKHAALVNDCFRKWDLSMEDVDLIASHGQTIYHAPQHLHRNKKFGNATLQIGDGDHIAVHTGIITVSDFRQKQIAAGGEGAPLAAYGDFILFAETEHNVMLLNIGGISNFTFIPAGNSFDKIICSDIGPGNTLMDAWVQQKYRGKYFDNNAEIARQGNIDESLLAILKENDFIKLAFPKTTGPELFNAEFIEQAIQQNKKTELSRGDVLATLNHFTADLICEAVEKLVKDYGNLNILVSGGGIHNPLLMEQLKNKLPDIKITSTAEKNIDPDAKEAVLFALLANECIAGDGKIFGKGSKHFPAISMGKISFPT